MKRVVKPSLKFSQKDEARQKTISRLIENILNYTLYFFLLYFVLSTLGLPVSSLLAGAGIAGVAIGMGAQASCQMWSMAFSSSLSAVSVEIS